MTIIFLAECGSKQQAEFFSRHFDAVSWTLKNSSIKSQCHAEIKQDCEGNWWCTLSVNSINWTPVNRQEANYRYFQILELQNFLREHLKSAPAFRYAFIGEIGEGDLNHLLSDASSNYRATYDYLISSRSSNQFSIPTFVYVLKVGFLLSEILWQQVGSPSKFESLIQGYVWLPPSPTLISGGIQAPPQEVIDQTTVRIAVDPQRAENYNQKGMELIRQRRFVEALANLEQAQKLSPFSPAIHQNKAACLYFLERFSEALQSCDLAINLNPDLSDLVIVYQLKGDIFYAQGQLEEALESFQNSLNLNPDASYAIHPYYQKGLILAKLGRYQEALDTCEFALRLYPNQGEIYELRLEILASFNQDR
ncbi:tetratricopeptide repeat protein [Fischerella sp. PCC 9605]|uniref:tetratricopeptide repeat protein n=1 Tax=Fischerella sp. PCC 9605 TaxID=1173024 RepID=UPI0004B590A5|nr:tetratricopeptide repeat protein [Fischerella sp. PCC 9605]